MHPIQSPICASLVIVSYIQIPFLLNNWDFLVLLYYVIKEMLLQVQRCKQQKLTVQ